MSSRDPVAHIPKDIGKMLAWEPKEFFRAARAGILLIQQCDLCCAYLGPGAWVCDVCQGKDLTWVQSPGTGTVYAVATVHQAYLAALNGELPYHIGIVELDEGLRLPTRIVLDRSTSTVAIGDRVRVHFAASGPRVVPVFRPEASS
jgi:uncharacterized OB-fold protein